MNKQKGAASLVFGVLVAFYAIALFLASLTEEKEPVESFSVECRNVTCERFFNDAVGNTSAIED